MKPSMDKSILSEIGKISSLRKKGKQHGKISSSLSGKWLLEVGDEIAIKFKKSFHLPKGSIMTIHRKRQYLLQTDGEVPDEEDLGPVLETIGAVEVIKIQKPGRALAKIIVASDAIEPGDSLYIWKEPPQ